MGKHIPRIERLEMLRQAEEIKLSFEQSLRKSANRKHIFKQIIEEVKKPSVDIETEKDPRYFVIQRVIENYKQSQKLEILAAFEQIYQLYGKYCQEWFSDSDYIMALLMLCKYQKNWLRPIEQWKPKGKQNYGRFLHLVAYLLTEYKAPAFLYHSFFHYHDHAHIPTFIALANGGSMKNVSLPLPLSKKMQYYFTQTPEGFRVKEALRWAQVRGLGGDEYLAYRIAYSSFTNKNYRNEDFWTEFLRIVIAGGMFNFEKFEEVYDYLSQKVRQDAKYSLKGRTLASLIRQSDEWHKANDLIKETKLKNLSWKRSNYTNLRIKEGKGVREMVYELQELTSSMKLVEEGQKMRNCVATYANLCNEGSTRIFSLREYAVGIENDRLATIEVDITSHRIVQAKYKFNKPISAKTKKMLSKWAMDNGLLMTKYL